MRVKSIVVLFVLHHIVLHLQVLAAESALWKICWHALLSRFYRFLFLFFREESLYTLDSYLHYSTFLSLFMGNRFVHVDLIDRYLSFLFFLTESLFVNVSRISTVFCFDFYLQVIVDSTRAKVYSSRSRRLALAADRIGFVVEPHDAILAVAHFISIF